MRIGLVGLSYHQRRPKDRFYEEALVEMGRRLGVRAEPVWLAGIDRPAESSQLEAIDGIVLTGGADVEPRRYGFEDRAGLCRFTLPQRDAAEIPMSNARSNGGSPLWRSVEA